MVFTGVWVTTSHLRCPGFFSIFQPILTMLWSWKSRFFLWSLLTLVSSSSLWRPFQMLWLQLLSLPPSCCAVFLFSPLARFMYSYNFSLYFLLFFLLCGSLEQLCSLADKVFLLIYIRSDLPAGIKLSVCILKSHRI